MRYTVLLALAVTTCVGSAVLRAQAPARPGIWQGVYGDLEPIQIPAQGEQPKAANFARVVVAGCLARGEANRFVLTSASEPVAAADKTPVPAPGAARVVLLNASPFNPETQIGQRVEARGIVYRDEKDILLAVSALTAVGACQN